MNEELKIFLKSKAKETSRGGYAFGMEGIHFSVIEMPLGISLQYHFIGERSAIEPTVIILNKNVSLQKFCNKLVEIVETIKS